MAGIFQDEKGNNSSSRYITVGCIVFGCFCVEQILLYAIFNEDVDIMTAANASIMIFGAIAGPILVWMYGKKSQELKDK